MPKNIKALVDEIMKWAQDAPPPPPNTYIDPNAPPPTPKPQQQGGGTGGGGGGGGGGGYTGNLGIKKMQDAMINLAKTVMRDAISQGMFGRRQQDTTNVRADDNTIKYKKAFNDFIAEQYSGALPDGYKGVEWSQDPTVQTQPDKAAGKTDLYELDAVLNTLRRIGSPGPGETEFKSDGFWQFRTNNALLNMMGLAYALLQMEGDFGVRAEDNSFSARDLDTMKNLLSGYEVDGDTVKMSDADKNSRATQLTPLLNRIAVLYLDFMAKITSRPSFRPLLEGARGFDKYNASGSNSDTLNDAERKQQEANATVRGIKINGYRDSKPYVVEEIPLSALQDKNSFVGFLRQIGYNDQQITSFGPQVLDKLIKQLDAYNPQKETGVGGRYDPNTI